ncbi:2b protein [Lilac ring mottle virus]|uniref:2b protein n=1 Tax=Lilac ring mottle virus TaxID=37125 RepID=B7T2J5_9BROM|nr:2b protein [Lilac ring mottle virus]ACJ68816.1 2b protein [Lilac ring mottle virus]
MMITDLGNRIDATGRCVHPGSEKFFRKGLYVMKRERILIHFILSLIITGQFVAEARLLYPQQMAIVSVGAPEKPARMVVKIPDLNIDLEIAEFTNPAVLIQTVYRRILGELKDSWYVLSWSTVKYNSIRDRLKILKNAQVHFSIPDSDWAFTLSLSDVVSGLSLPKIPVPKVYLSMSADSADTHDL